MKKVLRHGDWQLIEVSSKDFVGEKVKHGKDFIFAVGEATNHYHTIVAEREKDFELIKCPDGSYLVNFLAEAKATHPEHSLKGDLVIPIGTYRLTQRREKDWFQIATRKVID